jgi:hypothetical protein
VPNEVWSLRARVPLVAPHGKRGTLVLARSRHYGYEFDRLQRGEEVSANFSLVPVDAEPSHPDAADAAAVYLGIGSLLASPH